MTRTIGSALVFALVVVAMIAYHSAQALTQEARQHAHASSPPDSYYAAMPEGNPQ